MLSLTELRRVARVLDGTRRGARVEKIVQSENAQLALLLAGAETLPPQERFVLGLCARPGVARVSALRALPQAPAAPPQLAQWLRAHADGARLRGAQIEGADRQLRLRFDTREEKCSLLFSILGPRSNLYALDADDRVVASARPLAETRRDLALGAPWCSPEGGPPSEGADRFAATPDEELLGAIEAHYAEREEEAGEAALARRIAQALRKQRAAIERKLRLASEDAAQAGKAEQWKRFGELVAASLGSVKPGERSLRTRDFATGEAVEVPLDPRRSPAENKDEFFRRAKKAERTAAKAAQEISAAEERLAEHAALEARVAAAGEDAQALALLAGAPELARLLERFAPQPAPASTKPEKKAREWRIGKTVLAARLTPKVYRARDGLEIWVGKSDEGNDLLTTRLARGTDLFFHLEGNPGSHVVLRTEGKGEDAPPESVLDAAELAVHFSKAKNATRASVHVAAIKHVSKPSGAKPGLVYVSRGKTIQLRRDPDRLARVLAARVED
ncbi:MAG TPA: NFACT RNA binding domain-containing protein [Myxococcota bacterium]|nr:NFACT RNA binding domain-containing protein [Myxococcota bacterium]